MSFVNPLEGGPTIVAVAVGEAEGARCAAAALASAAAEVDRPSLFVDVGGKAPRPALLASGAAQKLEERLGAHLPDLGAAARGQVCHLAVSAQPDGLEAASAAIAVARGSTAVLHVPPDLLQATLDGETGPRPSGVLLRADLAVDRPLVGLAVRDLIVRGVAVAVLKRRLGWMVERRALFGAMPADGSGGLPPRLLRRLGVLSTDMEVRAQALEAAS
ncbi:MAG TPA: hypothetical protein VFS64_06710 [Solirubrobacterales bacterium]|nr:hypothetical protein [Solirubrobacterales bacterium]